MNEFKDFYIDVHGSNTQPGPIIGSAGKRVLDIMDEEPGQIITDLEAFSDAPFGNSHPSPDEEDDVILGPVPKPPPILSGPINVSRAVERYYMDIRDDFRLTSKGKPFKEDGHKPYITLHNWLKNHAAFNKDNDSFNEIHGAVEGEIDLFRVTDLWLKDFIHYLHHQDLSLNTVSGYIDNFHGFYGNLKTDGAVLPELTIRVASEATNAVFNDQAELKHLLNTTFDHESLAIGRDIFYAHSYLGFRVGTLQEFLSEPELYMFQSDGHWLIEIRTNKTGYIVTVPVKPAVLDILKRRKFDFEPAYFRQYYNELIKRMAFHAGLTKLVPYSITYGRKCIKFKEPKYNLMSSHTARRNFATNLFLAGVNPFKIMLITGHTTIESFMLYIKCDSRANAISLLGEPFFG